MLSSCDFILSAFTSLTSPRNFSVMCKIRVIWVGVEEGKENFKDLALKVENSLKKLGFKKDKEFVAHATVARVKKPINRDELIQVLESFENDFGWLNVDKFKLKQSILTQKGPIYKDIRVYDLK